MVEKRRKGQQWMPQVSPGPKWARVTCLVVSSSRLPCFCLSFTFVLFLYVGVPLIVMFCVNLQCCCLVLALLLFCIVSVWSCLLPVSLLVVSCFVSVLFCYCLSCLDHRPSSACPGRPCRLPGRSCRTGAAFPGGRPGRGLRGRTTIYEKEEKKEVGRRTNK